MNEIYLVIGFGNPGRGFRTTRHNAGFMVLDRLAARYGKHFMRMQSRAIIAQLIVEQKKLFLAKPQAFMNLSGQSVQGLIRFYKLPLDHLLVIHDDLDLPIGTIRIRPDGGAAGHKGMISTIERLGTDSFPRLRVGIGRPPGSMQAPDYVLQDFSPDELPLISEVMDRAADAVETWLTQGLDAAMNHFNGQV
jgi:PTH1 family peptidyl-tRNA hydrolase